MKALLLVALSLTACQGAKSGSTPLEAERPGFSTAPVLSCTQVAHAGQQHFQAVVVSHQRDFGRSLEARIFDTLVSRDVPIASLAACSGAIDDRTLRCLGNGPSRPGFAQTFAMSDVQLATIMASYTASRDFGAPTVVEFSCQPAP